MTKSLEKSVGRALLVTARLHRARMGERLNALGLFPGPGTGAEGAAGRRR